MAYSCCLRLHYLVALCVYSQWNSSRKAALCPSHAGSYLQLRPLPPLQLRRSISPPPASDSDGTGMNETMTALYCGKRDTPNRLWKMPLCVIQLVQSRQNPHSSRLVSIRRNVFAPPIPSNRMQCSRRPTRGKGCADGASDLSHAAHC